MKSKLIRVFMPEPIEITIGLAAITAISIFINPFDLMDRIFDLTEKNVGYHIGFTIIAFAISLPWYLRLKKKLRKYEEDLWDDKK